MIFFLNGNFQIKNFTKVLLHLMEVPGVRQQTESVFSGNLAR